MLLCVCLRILASLRIPRYDLGRQTPHFWGGSVTGLLRATPVAHLPRGSRLPHHVGAQATEVWVLNATKASRRGWGWIGSQPSARRGGGRFGIAVTGEGDGAEEGGGSGVALWPWSTAQHRRQHSWSVVQLWGMMATANRSSVVVLANGDGG
jgi:hypothetical protein